jgi:metallophosphoesterase superfamily enzyme
MNSKYSEELMNRKLEILEQLMKPVFFKEGGKRVLVIGDLHAPFIIDGYLEHCKKTYDEFQCDTVVFIGDEIDYHASSFHTSDPDGLSAGDEFKMAKQVIQEWYKVFPKATVIIGNHTRMIMRKAQAGGIPKDWIKSYNEVLNTPGWEYVMEAEIENVMYFHGEGSTATSKAKSECKSVVQGHRHSEGYVNYINNNVFALQVGTGIDRDSYAMAYGRAGKPSILSCGVVLNGLQAFIVKM